MKNKFGTIATLISTLLSLDACGGTGIVAYNEPINPKPTYESPLFDPGTRLGFFASVDLKEMDMTVRGDRDTTTMAIGPLFLTVIPWPPGIYRLIFDPDRTPDPPLPIEIRLAPKDGPVTFHAMKVSLLFDKGQRLLPKASFWVAPLKTLKMLGSESHYCDSKESKEMQTIEDAISITESSCLRLEYDAPAVPKEGFTLFIEGFSQTAQPISIPPIRFERGSHFDLYQLHF